MLAFKAANRDLRREINRATRETMNSPWKGLVKGNLFGDSVMAGKVLGTGVRIAAGNPPVAKAAQSTRAIGDGGRLVPRDDYAGWEFGGNRMAFSRYERKNPVRTVAPGRRRRGKPGTHVVERRTQMHLPRRTPEGRVVYPAFAELAPRMVSLWVQLIVKKYHDAAEGKG